MNMDSSNKNAIKREIVEIIETELDLDAENFEISLGDGGVLTIWGEVPSQQSYEELERLLYDMLDFDEIEYDVVVDEDLQAREESLTDADPDEFGFGEGPDIDDIPGSTSPRRQY